MIVAEGGCIPLEANCPYRTDPMCVKCKDSKCVQCHGDTVWHDNECLYW